MAPMRAGNNVYSVDVTRTRLNAASMCDALAVNRRRRQFLAARYRDDAQSGNRRERTN